MPGNTGAIDPFGDYGTVITLRYSRRRSEPGLPKLGTR